MLICQIQFIPCASYNLLVVECCEHREATCGFSKKKCQDQLVMPVADGGMGRGTGHVVHSGPGPGSQVLRRKAVSYQIQSDSKSHKLNGAQELDRYHERKIRQEGPMPMCVESTYLVEYFWKQVIAKSNSTGLNNIELHCFT